MELFLDLKVLGGCGEGGGDCGEGGGGCRVTDKSGGQRQLKGGSLVHEGGMGSVLRTEVRQVLGMM